MVFILPTVVFSEIFGSIVTTGVFDYSGSKNRKITLVPTSARLRLWGREGAGERWKRQQRAERHVRGKYDAALAKKIVFHPTPSVLAGVPVIANHTDMAESIAASVEKIGRRSQILSGSNVQ